MQRPNLETGFKAITSAANRQFTAQQPRFFLWTPPLLMLGIALFFSLPTDPPQYPPFIALGLLFFLWFATRKTRLRYLLTPALIIALGFTATHLRTHILAMPLITKEMHYREVTGEIEQVEPSEKKIKITLIHPTIEKLSTAETPPRITLTLRGEQAPLSAGDHIRLKATLLPLPTASMPGGFDFARMYFYNGIGGTGYGLSRPEILNSATATDSAMAITNLRHRIGEDMRNHMPQPYGAVAAAMSIGEAGPIPKHINEDLRDTGLYHILSISGFHLAVVTGIVFASLRLLLSLFPFLALRLNTKKIAGVLALCAAFAYLALAGYPLPAQRSFITVAFVFVAILFDRRGISLRSLCFAAIFLLLLFPDSLYSASFQLSFSATLAIVTLYENWPLPRPQSLLARIPLYLMGILLSSLAASLATAPFVVYDFNRLSVLGILSNMLVLPLASAIIMPAIILAVLLTPLGFQQWAYIPLQWGIHQMLTIAHTVSLWPLASIRLPSLTESGVCLSALGLLWLCLWRGRLRLFGIPMLLLSFVSITQHQPIDVFISANAKQTIVRLPDGSYTALKGTTRSYAVHSWLQSEAQEDLIPLSESGIPCDATSCTYTKNGHSLIMVTKPQAEGALDAACTQSPDILVAERYLKSTRCLNPKTLIGKNELADYGAHALRFTPNGIEILHTREPNTPLRQWQPLRDNDWEDAD